MARPREFELDDAVASAMAVFWKEGYAGANLPDLLEAMGIARGSFYKAFGSKKDLFLLALDRYDKTIVAPATLALNESQGDGVERIASVFENSLQTAVDGSRVGCLLCNTAAENGDVDPEITNKINDQLARLTDGFRAALANSDDWANASDDVLDAQANSLTLSYVGLRILSKSSGAGPLKWGVERTLASLRRDSQT